MNNFKIKIKKKDENIVPCPRCAKPTSNELHSCPYGCEIHNNCEENCNCCEDCEHECAMDI